MSCRSVSRRVSLAATALVGGAFLCGASGCGSDEGIQQVSVAEARALLGQSVSIFDVNGEAIREEFGVLSGAELLTSASDYNLARLPTDRNRSLLFYCSSNWCSASKIAARRARDAGYTSVFVMPEGIKGWKSAGGETQAFASR